MANEIECAAVEADVERLSAEADEFWARAEADTRAEYRFVARRDWAHRQYAADLAAEHLESLRSK